MALRSVFGPSRPEIWQQIAQDLGGNYIGEAFFGEDAVIYRHGEWQIVLDVRYQQEGGSTASYTRLRAPFINKDGFVFRIFRKRFLSFIGKLIGAQDVVIGDPVFDDPFIIQTNSEDRIRYLLEDEALKQLIQQQPDVWFEVRGDDGLFGVDFPDGVDQLYFESAGVIKDTPLLKGLFELFSLTLMRLVEMDSAYDSDPNVRLREA